MLEGSKTSSTTEISEWLGNDTVSEGEIKGVDVLGITITEGLDTSVGIRTSSLKTLFV